MCCSVLLFIFFIFVPHETSAPNPPTVTSFLKWPSFDSNTHQPFQPSDRDILVQFFKDAMCNSTSVNGWWKSSGWLDAFVSHCDWFGVTCDSQQQVIGLNLSSLGLKGPFPRILQHLEHLQWLDLSHNQWEGELDLGIFKDLNNLESLNVSWAWLTKISFLEMGSEQQQGWNKLEVIDLSFNPITEVDNNFGMFLSHTLRTLNFSDSNVRSLSFLKGLEVIEDLDLSDTHLLEEEQEVVWGFSKLKNLGMSGTNLREVGTIQSDVLERLYLDSNHLTTFPSGVLNLTTLKVLVLDWNSISITEDVNNLSRLEVFSCVGCSLPRGLKLNISSLVSLHLDWCCGGMIDVSELPQIEDLGLCIQDWIPKSLKNSTNLGHLNLQMSRGWVLPELPDSIVSLSIKIYWFHNVTLLPDSYAQGFQHLQFLSIVNDGPTLDLPSFLNLSQAENRTVILEGNLAGTLPSSFPNTVEFSLSRSQVSGTLSSEITMSTQLQRLELTDNPKINGSIPSELVMMTQLNALVLDHNNFDPEIPTFLSRLQVSFCSLSQPNFFCQWDGGISHVCNVQCRDYLNLKGVWMTEGYHLPDSVQMGMNWGSSQIQVNEDGTGSTWVWLNSNTESFQVRMDGTFETSNRIPISMNEARFNVTFAVDKVWFKPMLTPILPPTVESGCNQTTVVGEWNDFSDVECVKDV